MQILEVRETFSTQLIADENGKPSKDGEPVFEKRRDRESGELKLHRVDGELVPVMTKATRWHSLGVVSPLKDNDHLWLVEPLEADEDDARTFRAILIAYWPSVMRNDIGATAGFTLQRPSVEACPDLRLVEA